MKLLLSEMLPFTISLVCLWNRNQNSSQFLWMSYQLELFCMSGIYKHVIWHSVVVFDLLEVLFSKWITLRLHWAFALSHLTPIYGCFLHISAAAAWRRESNRLCPTLLPHTFYSVRDQWRGELNPALRLCVFVLGGDVHLHILAGSYVPILLVRRRNHDNANAWGLCMISLEGGQNVQP